MRVGDASRTSGASARSLRYYEDAGLIVPGRCGNGFRDYCGFTIDRVLVIRSLLESGLPLRLIREFLSCQAAEERTGADEEFLREVAQHRDRITSRIAVLASQEAALNAYLHSATQSATSD